MRMRTDPVIVAERRAKLARAMERARQANAALARAEQRADRAMVVVQYWVRRIRKADAPIQPRTSDRR